MQLRHRRFGLESSQSVFLKQYYSGERTLDQSEPDQLVGQCDPANVPQMQVFRLARLWPLGPNDKSPMFTAL